MLTSVAAQMQQLVTLPYNLLLHKTSREALGIDLKNHVVIVDEAHSEHQFFPTHCRIGGPTWPGPRQLIFHSGNSQTSLDLIDTVLSIHSCTLTSTLLGLSLAQVQCDIHVVDVTCGIFYLHSTA